MMTAQVMGILPAPQCEDQVGVGVVSAVHRMLICLLIPAILGLGGVTGSFAQSVTTGGKTMSLQLTSSAFKHGEMIPPKYTCDGPDVSPPLAWSGAPQGTQSFALIVDDPDAPRGTWVHWVLYDLPSSASSLPEAVPSIGQLSNGAKNGKNDFQRLGYGGPCPPSGTHRYFFKLYALDKPVGMPAGATKAELLRAIERHILAQAELMGLYKRR